MPLYRTRWLWIFSLAFCITAISACAKPSTNAPTRSPTQAPTRPLVTLAPPATSNPTPLPTPALAQPTPYPIGTATTREPSYPAPQTPEGARAPLTLLILHTNDVNGQTDPCG